MGVDPWGLIFKFARGNFKKLRIFYFRTLFSIREQQKLNDLTKFRQLPPNHWRSHEQGRARFLLGIRTPGCQEPPKNAKKLPHPHRMQKNGPGKARTTQNWKDNKGDTTALQLQLIFGVQKKRNIFK